MAGSSDVRGTAEAAVREALAGVELEWTESSPGVFAVTLPGTAKLKTECALEIGRYGMSVRAFVARRPDENHAATYRWLLEKNLRLNGIAFSVDTLGDIYLVGRYPNEAVTPSVIDQVLGAVAETADTCFNPILELGFAESIRREWAWRRSRGEPTANLAAFAHLDPGEPDPG